MTEIPAQFFEDFQFRTVREARNLKWANPEHTMLSAEVAFEELQSVQPWTPFGARSTGADTAHEQEVWDRGNAGDWGPIAEYEPPPLTNIALTQRQLRIALVQRGVDLDAFEAGLDPIQRIEFRYGDWFSRDQTLVAMLPLAPAEIDTLWREAAKL